MIIIIILMSLLGLTILGMVLSAIFAYDRCASGGFIISAVLSGVLLFSVITTGSICIGINQTSAVLSKEYELRETIETYKNDKALLESFHLITEGDKTTFTSDITFETVSTERYYSMIKDYNKKIFDFKVEVKQNQYERDNPWISWFINAGYKSITDDLLSQLEYTIGK